MASTAPAAGAAAMAPTATGPRTRPYKDFLTPALHRRFTNAALVSLVACWIASILMSDFHLFWSWFPLGINGVRTGLLFISCLTVYLLRLTNLHVGMRTDTSAMHGFWHVAISKRAIVTLFWYYTSAFLFSEVYIFTTLDSAKLEWIDQGRSYERARLNERAVLFRTMYVLLAICQTAAHLYLDFDAFLVSTKGSTGPAGTSSGHTGALPTQRMLQAAPRLGYLVLTIVGAVTVLGPVVYFAFARSYAWSMSYAVAKKLYPLAKATEPAGIAHAETLYTRFIWSSLLLVSLWQVTNLAFTVFGQQEPLKKGVPLTTDSTDPNGSLANGLKAKKALPHSVGLWELRIIAERLDDRRKTIYNDFERPSSTSWADVAAVCIGEIEGVSTTITAAQTAHLPKQPAPAAPAPPPKQHIAAPIKQDQAVFSPSARPKTTLDALANGVGAVAKSFGQSQNGSPVAPRAKEFFSSSTKAIMPSQSQQQSSNSGLIHQARSYAIRFLCSPAGHLFRYTFRRQAVAMIFGTPYSNAANVQNAAQAISRLAVCSLREDNFGQVQKDIPRILRVFVNTIRQIQTLMATLEPHWTDVYFDEGKRSVPEVEELLTTLKKGLGDIVMTFGEYIDALGISRAELRVAKELAGQGAEMIQKS